MIPPVEDPSAAESKSLFERAGAALPVALTLLATTFAGMSTSELQRAMFWRSYAAQDQAKATSQWSLAGFKRDRSLICETTAAQLRIAAGGQAATFTADPGSPVETREAVKWLNGDGPPRMALPTIEDPNLKRLLDDIRTRQPEAELLDRAARVTQDSINQALDHAELEIERIDKQWETILDEAKKLVTAKLTSADPKQAPAAMVANYELENRRYRGESYLNQGVGFLYEARVKVSTAESDRHRQRSQNIFYAMLSAQAGAAVSSLALARKQRSLLWLFAGIAGLISLGIAAWIFLGS